MKEKLKAPNEYKNSENMKTRICQRNLKHFGLLVLTSLLVLQFFIIKCDASQGKQHFIHQVLNNSSIFIEQ